MKKLITAALSLLLMMFTPVLASANDGVKSFSFSDVNTNAWYGPAVSYMRDHGIISGYGNGTFGPNDPMTRAQFATILWKYYNPDEAASYNPAFATNETGLPDVKNGQWYTGAANWAVKNGMIHGAKIDSQTYFQPDENMTFEQEIVILAQAIGQSPL